MPFLFPRRIMRRTVGGFTLIELLVAISIIGIMISMLLPAIQAAREAARRMTCKNNLRQLSLAIQNYENGKKAYPPSGIVATTGDIYESRSGPMFSWIVTVLPYMEAAPLFKQFDMRKTVLEQPNNPQATPVDTLICPSDSTWGRYFSDPVLTDDKQFAKGNYAAFVSPFHTELQIVFPGALISKKQMISNIRDGLAHTLMLSEVRTRSQPQDQRGAWALPWTGSSLLAFDMHHLGIFSGRFVGSPWSLGETQPPNNRGPNVDMLYACPDIGDAQLRNMPCGIWQKNSRFEYLSAAPRSMHSGGVNVAFMDGHVGFLLNDIDEYAMAYLISINDGRPIGLNDWVH